MTGDYQDEEHHQRDHQKQQFDIMAIDQNPVFPSTITMDEEIQLNSAVGDGENIELTESSDLSRIILLNYYKLINLISAERGWIISQNETSFLLECYFSFFQT